MKALQRFLIPNLLKKININVKSFIKIKCIL